LDVGRVLNPSASAKRPPSAADGLRTRPTLTFVVAAVIAAAAFGQERNLWRTSADIAEGARGTAIGTVTEIQAGRSRIVFVPDDSPGDSITVDADSVSTQYNGFGGTINGAPEIFVGTAGFPHIRDGDRVGVRGTRP